MQKIITLLGNKKEFYVALTILLDRNEKMYLFLSSESEPCKKIKLCLQIRKQNKITSAHQTRHLDAIKPDSIGMRGKRCVTADTFPDTGK